MLRTFLPRLSSGPEFRGLRVRVVMLDRLSWPDEECEKPEQEEGRQDPLEPDVLSEAARVMSVVVELASGSLCQRRRRAMNRATRELRMRAVGAKPGVSRGVSALSVGGVVPGVVLVWNHDDRHTRI